MATEYPPLNKIYVFGYSANDRDFPILSATADPRVAGYQVPKDLSACPDKRYPNHVFTGAQPISGDQRVRHVWEILPSPWVPFTRYDDDLGPIQGRRRSVKNNGQVASLTAETRTTYEAREGSAIVYTELEEAWSVKTDEDGNSLFPIRDRDFYDPSRGPVQERRQLFVPTGEEEASLENVNGIITQTSYEPYNEFLSFKVVQTYKVSGPQLIGKATNNEGQLTTVTTQRKGALNYIPPSPTATRSVEASREDAESLVERIIDTPEVFSGQVLSVERPDPVPQKFRVNLPTLTSQSTIEGTASTPSLTSIDLSKSEQQVTKFVKRISTTSRDLVGEATLSGEVYTSELGGGIATVTESYGTNPEIDPTTGTVSSEKENLGNDQFYVRQVKLTTPLPELKGQNYDETLDVAIPFTRQFVEAGTEFPEESASINPRDTLHSEITKFDYEEARDRLLAIEYATPVIEQIGLPDRLLGAVLYVYYTNDGGNSTQEGSTYAFNVSGAVNTTAQLFFETEDGFNGQVDAISHLFFMRKELCTIDAIRAKLNAESWPIIRPQNEKILVTTKSDSISARFSASLPDNFVNAFERNRTRDLTTFAIPPTLHTALPINLNVNGNPAFTISGQYNKPPFGTIIQYSYEMLGETSIIDGSIAATEPPSFPTGKFIYRLSTSPFRFGLVRVEATVVDVTSEMV
jgi:hypothetical protein